MTVFVEIGRNIVAVRRSKGLSQEKLAEKTDMSVSYLRLIERGKANPTVLSLLRIAETLDTSFSVVVHIAEEDDC